MVCHMRRSSSQSVPQLRLAYEERIRGLEEMLLLRDKSISQLRESLAAADGDYKKVWLLLGERPRGAGAYSQA